MTEETRDFDTFYTDLPVCPYCGNQETNWREVSQFKGNGDVKNVICLSCGKEYQLEFYVSYNFTTDRLEDLDTDTSPTSSSGEDVPPEDVPFDIDSVI